MVSITQLVECQIVTLVVIGSTPITYPILYNIKKFKINDKLNLLDISSLNFFKKTVNINNLNIIFDNYDFKHKDKFLELFILIYGAININYLTIKQLNDNTGKN